MKKQVQPTAARQPTALHVSRTCRVRAKRRRITFHVSRFTHHTSQSNSVKLRQVQQRRAERRSPTRREPVKAETGRVGDRRSAFTEALRSVPPFPEFWDPWAVYNLVN